MNSIMSIIPARGGSKGIPRKNILPLAGKPLIAHTIEQAHRSTYINRVVVSTDDPEIAAISQQYGAEVVWRPVEISGDMASSEAALLHAIDYLASAEDYHPALMVFLQCTSPLTLAEDIDGTIQALLEQNTDTALAVSHFHYFLWREDEDGDTVGINHDKYVRLLRQQRESQYRETGAVYVMRTQGFLENKHRFFGKTAHYIIPAERCLEIDEPVDFTVAEMLIRHQQRAHMQSLLPSPVHALVMDFDGVFTDNRVLVFQDGQEAVFSHRGDGWGLSTLKRFGLPLLVISTEKNPVVQARCDKLGIPCLQGVDDKLAVLQQWTTSNTLDIAKMIYLGNDVNDLSCLQSVGCGVVVHDAHPDVLAVAKIILETDGGQGAIRELADLLMTHLQNIPNKEGLHGA